MNIKLKDIIKVRTICKKCKSPVICIEWSPLGSSYTCQKCGYTTNNRDKIEKEVVNGNTKV